MPAAVRPNIAANANAATVIAGHPAARPRAAATHAQEPAKIWVASVSRLVELSRGCGTAGRRSYYHTAKRQVKARPFLCVRCADLARPRSRRPGEGAAARHARRSRTVITLPQRSNVGTGKLHAAP
jgi:hypothetical protein